MYVHRIKSKKGIKSKFKNNARIEINFDLAMIIIY